MCHSLLVLHSLFALHPTFTWDLGMSAFIYKAFCLLKKREFTAFLNLVMHQSVLVEIITLFVWLFLQDFCYATWD